MIPVLYEASETQFTNNGIGPLADAISCVVTEERNGQYELRMEYPTTGVHFEEIQETRIILAKAQDTGSTQPFVIYKISKPMNGVVEINAEHISYRLNGAVEMPFTASTITELFNGKITANMATSEPFTFVTDINSGEGYSITLPMQVRAMLGGTEGSILQKYGGEWEFNRFQCKLWAARGSDNAVTLRYGKNITDIKSVVDMTSVYTGIVPFWTNEDQTVTLPEKVIMSSHASDYPFSIVKVVDFSGDFEDPPTEAQLRAIATEYVEANQGWTLKNNIDVSFVALWETEQYKDVAPLERVNLCDLVTVIYEPLGVNFKTKVVKTEYDTLLERYRSVTLGDQAFNIGAIIQDTVTESEKTTTSRMRNAVEHATKLIQGGLGGHVVMGVNADGEPEEILIMDTDSVATATNVIRMNLAGIGFSDSGYEGPFDTAWTIDGHFVADYIDTGTLNADLIKTGTLNASLATITNINASNINTGALNADLITTGTLDASKATVTNLNASNITSGTINASVVSVTNIDASNITTGSMSADRITTGTLNAANVSVTNINASNITTGEMSASRIKGGTLQLGIQAGYADGSIEVGATNGNITIDKNGIKVERTRWSTNDYMKMDNGSLSIYQSNALKGKFDASGTSYGGVIELYASSTYNTYSRLENSGLTVYGSSTSTYSSVGAGNISINGSTYSADILRVTGASSSNHNALSIDGWAYLPGIRGGAIYADSTHIGFFGKTSGTTKQTIAKASTGTSATASNCAEKLNALLTALNSYGLITSS